MNVSGYISYFRNLAINHSLLLHNPDGESADAEPGSIHFTKISVDEVLTGLRSKVGFPLLALELYEVTTDSEVQYDIRQRTRGAFMVIDHPAKDNFTAEQACYENSEQILTDILKQIWQDHYGEGVNRCETPFREFSFHNLQIIPVGPIFDKEFGYRVEFEFEFHSTINFTDPPAPNTFNRYVIDNDTSFIIVP